MPYSDDELWEIYRKTNGYCHYCGKKLSWENYGVHGEKGAWHVDHKNPRMAEGSDYLRNLVSACIDCNLDKKHRHARGYAAKWQPATLGGQIVSFFGLPEGFLGASRRRPRTR